MARRHLMPIFVGVGAFMVASALSTHLALEAQAPASPTATGTGKAWTAPRTLDGQPDLQGIWDFRTVTPLERPRNLAGKDVLTEAEAAAFEKQQVDRQNKDNRNVPASVDVESAYNDFWWDYGTKMVGSRRTSLIVDPPDGRIPALTPGAQARAQAPRQRPVLERIVIGSVAEGPEDLGISERCLVGFSSGPPVVPGAYNNNLQIFQSSGYVAILTEMIHEARIVPLDGRPHLPQNIRHWLGDSRGRWEGQTLVIDTSNFTEKAAFSGTLTARGGASAHMHLTERFTRVAPDTLLYEFTVEDDTTWVRPWTVQVPMRKSDQKMYEYACHEGNYGMANMLAGARSKERAAAIGKK